MSAVGVKEAAAVRSKLLDNFLRRDWSLRDVLVGDCVHHWLSIRVNQRLAVRACLLYLLRFHQRGNVIRLEVLRHSLPHQQQRTNNTSRHEHPQRATNKINPEVAYRFLLTPHDASNERNR